MNFAAPSALVWAALIVPIVTLYILKVRLRRVPVSTNLFWKQLYDEKPPRSIWHYLRHLLSLLAQIVLVLLLVIAVADPYLPWQLLQARRIVAVIDNSASMRATDIRPSRFEAAIDAALATADGLRFRDQMAVVLAGSEAQVVVGMTSHVPTLKRALRNIQVSDTPTTIDAAVELAQRLIGKHPHGHVIVFSDGAGSAASSKPSETTEATAAESVSLPEAGSPAGQADPRPVAVEYRHIGTPQAGNVGITQLQVRRSLQDPIGYELLITVKNASNEHIQGRVELELDGVPVDVLPLDLASEAVFTRSLEKTSLAGGTLLAKLTQLTVKNASSDEAAQDISDDEPPDARNKSGTLIVNALPTDDRAWAILPPRQMQDVLLVTPPPGNLFLQKVLEANPLVRLTTAEQVPSNLPENVICIVLGAVPETLPDGNLFLVDPRSDCDAWIVGDLIDTPIVAEQDKDSALMMHVRLDNVVMPAARRLTFSQPPHVLAGTLSGDAVYAQIKRKKGKCLVLSVDINEGDLAFRTAFPIMMTNALGWFGDSAGELRSALATGSVTHVQLTDSQVASARQLMLRSPQGDVQPLHLSHNDQRESQHQPLDSGREPEQQSYPLAIPPLNQCGVWSVVAGENADQAQSLIALAVNLANEAESDLRTAANSEQQGQTRLLASWLTRPIWFYLVASACVFLVVEWWLYQRRFLT